LSALASSLPYALRIIGVRATQALEEIFLPALMPVISNGAMLYLAQKMLEPSSLLSIMVVAGSAH
jgi:hypothetical protein